MTGMTSDPSTVADSISADSEANWITPIGIPSSLNKLTGIQEGDKIADLGGGTGKLGRKVAEQRPEAEVVTTDLSSEAVAEANNNSEEYRNHHVVQAAGLKGFRDSYFSQVYAANVLQAMDDPEKGLKEIFDKLEEEGTAVITVPGEESAEIFPEEAQFYDEELEIPYIEVPGQVEGEEITYSQYILPEGWVKNTADDIGLEVEEGYPEKILSDPTGIPKINEICEEEYSPEIPSGAAYAIEKTPSNLIRKIVEYTGLGPEVDLWIMEK